MSMSQKLWEAVEAYVLACGGDPRTFSLGVHEARLLFYKTLGEVIASHRSSQEEITRRERRQNEGTRQGRGSSSPTEGSSQAPPSAPPV